MIALVSCRSSALAGSHALIVPWAQPERTSVRRAHGKPSTKGRAVGGRLGAGSWELGAGSVGGEQEQADYSEAQPGRRRIGLPVVHACI